MLAVKSGDSVLTTGVLLSDDDFGRGGSESKVGRQAGDLTYDDDDVVGCVIGEARGGDGNPIVAGIKQRDIEEAAAVGRRLGNRIGCLVLDGDGCARNNCPGRIGNSSGDPALSAGLRI